MVAFVPVDRAAEIRRLREAAGLTQHPEVLPSTADFTNPVWLTLARLLEGKTLMEVSSETGVANGSLSAWLSMAARAHEYTGATDLLLFFVKTYLGDDYMHAVGGQVHAQLRNHIEAALGPVSPVDVRQALKDFVEVPPGRQTGEQRAAKLGIGNTQRKGVLTDIRAALGWIGATPTYFWVMCYLAASFEKYQSEEWFGDHVRIFTEPSA